MLTRFQSINGGVPLAGRPVSFVLRLFALCSAAIIAATATFAAITPPRWGDSAPTSSSQVLSYVLGIMSNLPPETVDQE